MEFKESRAIYLQIADYLLEKILTKKWKEGERIPSVREVAIDLQVNPNTSMRTFAYLQEMGVIFNKRGIGYFVADDATKNAIKIKKDEFINSSAPEFFRTAKLLGISEKDIISLYNKN
jgi:GntR family transcriptional regulator